MLDSAFSLVGAELKPSATYIVIMYSQKLSRLDSNQTLHWMSGYRWLKQTNISETNSISILTVQIWFNTHPPQIIYLHKARV